MTSRPLAKFVAGMTSGLQLGGQMGDRMMRHQDRRDALEVAREKNRTAAMIHRDKMGLESGKAAAYIEQARANAQKLLAQARKASAGPAAGGGSDPAIAGFLAKYPAPVEADSGAGPAQVTVQAPENDTMYEPPTATPDAPDVSAARGGRIRGGGMNMGNLAYGTAMAVNRFRDGPPKPAAPTAGTNGPGTGYGEQAAPPTTAISTGTGETYRRGGAVRKYAGGGLVIDSPAYVRGAQYGQQADLDARGIPPLPDADPYWATDAQNDDPRLQYEIEQRRRSEGLQGMVAPPQDYPVMGRQQEWQGETDRPGAPRKSYREQFADRRVAERGPPGGAGPAMRDPGETGGTPEPTDMPMRDPGETGGQPMVASRGPMAGPQRPASAGGAGGGGGARGINTGAPRGGALRDQSREKAYDPQADLYDPDNAHMVDEKGQVKSALAGATAYADRVMGAGNTPGQLQGQAGGEGGAPGPGIGSGRAQQELFGGKGAADPKVMEQVFKVVDPDNKLSMDQKMIKAIAQVSAYHTANGDKASAEQASFEVAQFANKVASEHGKQAIQMMQKGDMQGGIAKLIEGYNYLPDGLTASLEGGNIVLKDESGKVSAQYPMDERAAKNIALGMATGQLGWDVIRMGGQQTQLASSPPGAGGAPAPQQAAAPPGGPPPMPAGREPMDERPNARPAAQPQAAPAGPEVPPPAAAPTQTPATAAPSAAAPARPAPQTQSQPSAPVPSPTPPPAAKSPDSASATPPGVVVGDQTPQTPKKGIDTNAPKPKTVEDEEREHFSKNPYAPLPGTMRTVAPEPKQLRALTDKIAATTKEWDEKRSEMIKDAEIAKSKSTVKQSRSLIDKVIAHHDKRYNDWLKTAQAEVTRLQNLQDRADSHERDTDLKPRDAQRADESKADTVFTERGQAMLDNANRPTRSSGPEKQAGDKRKADVSASVARYAKDPKDLEPLKRVAKSIWMNNRKMTENEAFDAAVAVTSIKPNGVGENYQKGQFATTFKPIASDLRRGVVLQFPDPAEPGNARGGRRLHVDEGTYNEIRQMHRANWGNWSEGEKKRKEEEGKKPGAMEGLKMLVPTLTGPIGLGAVNGR